MIIVDSKKIWGQRSSSPSHHLASTQGKAAYAAETENRVRWRLIREWQGMRGYWVDLERGSYQNINTVTCSILQHPDPLQFRLTLNGTPVVVWCQLEASGGKSRKIRGNRKRASLTHKNWPVQKSLLAGTGSLNDMSHPKGSLQSRATNIARKVRYVRAHMRVENHAWNGWLIKHALKHSRTLRSYFIQ